MNSNRRFSRISGVIPAAVYLVILGIGLVGFEGAKIYQGFGNLFGHDSKQKQQVQNLNTDLAGLKSANETAAAARAAETVARNKYEASLEKNLESVHELVSGSLYSLDHEPHPTVYVQTARSLLSDADRAMDPLDQKRLDAMKALVDKLNSDVASVRAQGERDHAELVDQLKTERTATSLALAGKKTAEAEADASNAKKDLAVKVSVGQGQQLVAWAADNDDLKTRVLKLTIAIVAMVVTLAFIHWLMPMLAIACPALAPVAHGLAYLIALPMQLLHKLEAAAASRAAAATASDLADSQVALAAEQAAHAKTTQTLVAVALTPDNPPAPAAVAIPAPTHA